MWYDVNTKVICSLIKCILHTKYIVIGAMVYFE